VNYAFPKRSWDGQELIGGLEPGWLAEWQNGRNVKTFSTFFLSVPGKIHFQVFLYANVLKSAQCDHSNTKVDPRCSRNTPSQLIKSYRVLWAAE
jgi:hypothetical protein